MDDVTIYIYRDWYWVEPDDEDNSDEISFYDRFKASQYRRPIRDYALLFWDHFHYKNGFLMEYNEYICSRV